MFWHFAIFISYSCTTANDFPLWNELLNENSRICCSYHYGLTRFFRFYPKIVLTVLNSSWLKIIINYYYCKMINLVNLILSNTINPQSNLKCISAFKTVYIILFYPELHINSQNFIQFNNKTQKFLVISILEKYLNSTLENRFFFFFLEIGSYQFSLIFTRVAQWIAQIQTGRAQIAFVLAGSLKISVRAGLEKRASAGWVEKTPSTSFSFREAEKVHRINFW